jgi:anti-sigma factor RsiW
MSASEAGHVSLAALHARLDGDHGDQEVGRHLSSCAECAARLAALGEQRGALLALSEHGASSPWTEAARRAGREALADLLAALADACLTDAPGVAEARRRRVRELATLRERLEKLGAPVPLEELPAADEFERAQAPDRPLARRCLEALVALEGHSERVAALAARC